MKLVVKGLSTKILPELSVKKKNERGTGVPGNIFLLIRGGFPQGTVKIQ